MLTNLRTALLDLLYEVQETEVKLIIGGGYGIYLRTENVRKSGNKTLFDIWPAARSTNDLDLFLRPELLIESDKLKPLSIAIKKLGYKSVPGSEHYQFKKPGPDGSEAGSIKIDILTGPSNRFKNTGVKVDERRVRPRPSIGLHAHPANEALTLDKGLHGVKFKGDLSSGESWEGEVYLPHVFTFLMMKLFAFKDRFEDEDKEFGRYHALDLYTILATTTENEWEQALEFRDQYSKDEMTIEAGNLIHQYFSDRNRMGIVRLKEGGYYRDDFQLDNFISSLQELFPKR
jgi:hypothetical protein